MPGREPDNHSNSGFVGRVEQVPQVGGQLGLPGFIKKDGFVVAVDRRGNELFRFRDESETRGSGQHSASEPENPIFGDTSRVMGEASSAPIEDPAVVAYKSIEGRWTGRNSLGGLAERLFGGGRRAQEALDPEFMSGAPRFYPREKIGVLAFRNSAGGMELIKFPFDPENPAGFINWVRDRVIRFEGNKLGTENKAAQQQLERAIQVITQLDILRESEGMGEIPDSRAGEMKKWIEDLNNEVISRVRLGSLYVELLFLKDGSEIQKLLSGLPNAGLKRFLIKMPEVLELLKAMDEPEMAERLLRDLYTPVGEAGKIGDETRSERELKNRARNIISNRYPSLARNEDFVKLAAQGAYNVAIALWHVSARAEARDQVVDKDTGEVLPPGSLNDENPLVNDGKVEWLTGGNRPAGFKLLREIMGMKKHLATVKKSWGIPWIGLINRLGNSRQVENAGNDFFSSLVTGLEGYYAGLARVGLIARGMGSAEAKTEGQRRARQLIETVILPGTSKVLKEGKTPGSTDPEDYEWPTDRDGLISIRNLNLDMSEDDKRVVRELLLLDETAGAEVDISHAFSELPALAEWGRFNIGIASSTKEALTDKDKGLVVNPVASTKEGMEKVLSQLYKAFGVDIPALAGKRRAAIENEIAFMSHHDENAVGVSNWDVKQAEMFANLAAVATEERKPFLKREEAAQAVEAGRKEVPGYVRHIGSVYSQVFIDPLVHAARLAVDRNYRNRYGAATKRSVINFFKTLLGAVFAALGKGIREVFSRGLSQK